MQKEVQVFCKGFWSAWTPPIDRVISLERIFIMIGNHGIPTQVPYSRADENIVNFVTIVFALVAGQELLYPFPPNTCNEHECGLK